MKKVFDKLRQTCYTNNVIKVDDLNNQKGFDKMKATGIVRRVDDLGRVVIPKEIRRTLNIREGNALEIYTTDGGVLFRKYTQSAESKAATAQD